MPGLYWRNNLTASRLFGRPGPGPFFQQGPGLFDLGQPGLPSLQFLRQLIATTIRAVRRVLGGIGRRRLGEDLGDLLLQPCLFLGHAVVAHRLVARGVGFDLGAVQGDGPDLGQTGQGAELEHVDEQGLEAGQVSFAEVADGPDVGDVVADDDAAGDINVAASHDLA